MTKDTQPKPPKKKTCKHCKSKFIPDRPLQYVCTPACAFNHQQKKRQQKQKEAEAETRRAWSKRKSDLKPLSHWISLTQRAFNDFIRLRDGNVCISCGSTTAVTYHAGHYRTTAVASQHRFNEDGCHSQCSACNIHLSGNISPYRVNLIEKIGLQRVTALETDNTHRRYTRDELEAIRVHYRALIREMTKQQEEAA